MPRREPLGEHTERAVQIIASLLRQEDADVYNWVDEAAREDAVSTIYALAGIAGRLATIVGVNMQREPVEVLEASTAGAPTSALGFEPRLIAYVVEVGEEVPGVAQYAGFTERSDAERLVGRVQEQGDEPVRINVLPIYRRYDDYEYDR